MIDKLKSIKEFKDLIAYNNPKELVAKYLMNYIDIMHITLELGMFVPCVDGVPLVDPDLNSSFYDKQVYYKAENNVLFKGFEVDEITTSKIYITNGNIYLSFDKETKTQISKMDMVKLCKYNIELTEACKQLITK